MKTLVCEKCRRSFLVQDITVEDIYGMIEEDPDTELQLMCNECTHSEMSKQVFFTPEEEDDEDF